jgi:hypothetical protein
MHDSAVFFLEGGSFDMGNIQLGQDFFGSKWTALCSGDGYTIQVDYPIATIPMFGQMCYLFERNKFANCNFWGTWTIGILHRNNLYNIWFLLHSLVYPQILAQHEAI